MHGNQVINHPFLYLLHQICQLSRELQIQLLLLCNELIFLMHLPPQGFHLYEALLELLALLI